MAFDLADVLVLVGASSGVIKLWDLEEAKKSLTNGPAKASRKTGYGRTPSILVLLPTRELACQVHADFEVYGGALGLSSCCLYGGAPYQAQEIKLMIGVDIVIGTSGRIKDHIERENIDMSQLKFRVLDEADEMRTMGFVQDVELILGVWFIYLFSMHRVLLSAKC